MQRILRWAPLLLVTACGTPLPFEPAGPSAAPDPSTFGPFAVGVRTVVFEDLTRTTPGRTGARRLVTELWYPAHESARSAPGHDYDIASLLPDSIRAQLTDVDLGVIPTSAVRDASPDSEHGPYPLVLFSHGNAAVRMQSTFLVVALASHGYVVAAPDHEGNTLADYDDLSEFLPSEFLGSYLDRPRDLLFLLDRLTKRLPADDPLVGLADPERVGVTGHSFGAVTALRTAGLDARIDATVPMASASHLIAWLDVDRDLEDVGIPVMLMAGGKDHTTPASDSDSVWAHVAAPGWYLTLERAGHFTFSDFCRLDTEAIETGSRFGIGDIVEDGCGPDNVEPDLAHPIIRRFAIGLFNQTLRGSADSSRYLQLSADDAREGTLQVK